MKRKILILICTMFMMITIMTEWLLPEHIVSQNNSKSYAAVNKYVSTFEELEQALSSREELSITLKKDITVKALLRVRGRKVLNGNGTYSIRRRAAKDNTYRGTLLHMQGEYLKLKNITVSGNGKNSNMSGEINGRLVEVCSGTLLLDTGAKLCTNYNLASYTDGGGGITIHSGGKAVMKTGSVISDNLTITGGSGVRVDKGASFVMEGGAIKGNAVIGQKEGSDFDGRGGAIHNRGSVVIQGGVIRDNLARGHEKQDEVHGGFGGGIYNQSQLKITGGEIKENQASFAGGGIYTNADSRVVLEGGSICSNRSLGQRGGGIYLSAKATVSVIGGHIEKNEAEDGTQIFLSSNSSGMLRISGGAVKGERDAIYNNGGNIAVRGGTIEGNGYGIRYVAGNLYLSGTPYINSIFLGDKQMLTADRKIQKGFTCMICPDVYREGRKLVSVTSGESPEQVKEAFTLKKRKRFMLESGDDGVYIGREKYYIQFDANGGEGNMPVQSIYVDEAQAIHKCSFWREGYGFAGWSEKPVSVVSKRDICYRDGEVVKNLKENGSRLKLYALWVKKPVIKGGNATFTFYEEEFVERKVLLHGVSAEDECDGDITSEMRVEKLILPDQSEVVDFESVPTGREKLGSGQIIYGVTNSFGISATYIQNYEVLPNKAPDIKVFDRYFFQSEFAGQEQKEIKESILKCVSWNDDVDTGEQLKRNLDVQWGKIDFGTPGEYRVGIHLRDQYGHRFYMPEGEEGQYGAGKSSESFFTVYIVGGDTEIQEQKMGYVRFISPDHVGHLASDSVWKSGNLRDKLDATFEKEERDYEEVWVINGEDKKRIRQFINERENPFSQETNDLFDERFFYMRKERKD